MMVLKRRKMMMLIRNRMMIVMMPPQTVADDFNMKEQLESILTSIDFNQKRSRTMDVDDFLL